MVPVSIVSFPTPEVYSIGRPLFNAVTIHLSGDKDFRIVATNNSPENKYIQSATLNGKPLEKPFFSHDELMEGGTLELVMGSEPSQWGAF